MELDPAQQACGGLYTEYFLEAAAHMRVEVVHDQVHLAYPRVPSPQHPADEAHEIGLGAPLGQLGMAAAAAQLHRHEDVAAPGAPCTRSPAAAGFHQASRTGAGASRTAAALYMFRYLGIDVLERAQARLEAEMLGPYGQPFVGTADPTLKSLASTLTGSNAGGGQSRRCF